MRKIRKLSLYGILGIVICALILIGISSLDANSIGEKRVKPPPEPEDTWAVRIPTFDSGNMFYGVREGDDVYYEDNDPNIVVSVNKNSMAGPWGKYFDFTYAFDFTITNENFGTSTPPANQVGFQYVGDLDVIEGNSSFQFPGGDIVTFLNGTHPHAGGAGEEDYQYFWFRINIFDQDIELMETGESYLFGDGPDAGEEGDFLRMVARYRQECYPEPLYHDVELYRSINWARAQTAVPPNPQNIEIERLDAAAYNEEFEIECEAVWRFWVHPVGHNNIIPGFLKVYDRYCTREKNKTKWHYPMEAKGTFNFYIDWIKNPGSPTQPEEPPDPPNNLSAAAPVCEQIDLSWNDNSDNEDGFEIEKSLDGSIFNPLATVGANVETYNDIGLTGEIQYWYQVKAYNEVGPSDYSNASATTPTCGTEPPAAPTGLTANARGKAKIALNWTDSSTNEEKFIIYSGLSESNLFWLAEVGSNTTSYVDKGLDSNTTYYYKVCAYNEDGESNYSNPASATTK